MQGLNKKAGRTCVFWVVCGRAVEYSRGGGVQGKAVELAARRRDPVSGRLLLFSRRLYIHTLQVSVSDTVCLNYSTILPVPGTCTSTLELSMFTVGSYY